MGLKTCRHQPLQTSGRRWPIDGGQAHPRLSSPAVIGERGTGQVWGPV
jgi:hypothetical protein